MLWRRRQARWWDVSHEALLHNLAERTTANAEAMIYWATVIIMTRRPGPTVAVLSWDEAGARRDQAPLAPAPGAVGVALTRLAADALTLLTSGDGRLPAPCGAHGCIRWFLRTHASRQWCSDRCGDRVRAARHYARRHPAAEP